LLDVFVCVVTRRIRVKAIKSKLGVKTEVRSDGHVRSEKIARPVTEDAQLHLPTERAGHDKVELADEPGSGTAPEGALSIRKKPFKWRPGVSALAWPPAKDRFPLVEIVGEPVSPEQITPQADPSKAEFAARLWVRRVGFEASENLPDDQREACERFCLRHRLTVLSCFHRRLKRADVVAALRELWVTYSA
jgi:hypothetical protein